MFDFEEFLTLFVYFNMIYADELVWEFRVLGLKNHLVIESRLSVVSFLQDETDQGVLAQVLEFLFDIMLYLDQ